LFGGVVDPASNIAVAVVEHMVVFSRVVDKGMT
jgi:hypothetical protein